jgi:hypothetical protein
LLPTRQKLLEYQLADFRVSFLCYWHQETFVDLQDEEGGIK